MRFPLNLKFATLALLLSIILLYLKKRDEPMIKDKRETVVPPSEDWSEEADYHCRLTLFYMRTTGGFTTIKLVLNLNMQELSAWVPRLDWPYQWKEDYEQPFEYTLHEAVEENNDNEKSKFNYVKALVEFEKKVKTHSMKKDFINYIQSLRITNSLSTYEIFAIAAIFPNLKAVSIKFYMDIKEDSKYVHPIKVPKQVTLLQIDENWLTERSFVAVLNNFPSLEKVELKDIWYWDGDWSMNYRKFDNVRYFSMDSCHFVNKGAWERTSNLFPNLVELTIKSFYYRRTVNLDNLEEFSGKDFTTVLESKEKLEKFIVSDASLSGLASHLPSVHLSSTISIWVEKSRVQHEDYEALAEWCRSMKNCDFKDPWTYINISPTGDKDF